MSGQAKTARTNSAGQQTQSRLFAGPRSIALPRLMLVLSVFLLTVIGLVMVFSASSIEAISEDASPAAYLTRQFAVAVGSVLLCCGVAFACPYYTWLGKRLWVAWAVVVFLLLLTAAIGTAELGAQRWLVLGPVNFQPSELAKPGFVLVMARILYKYRVENAYSFSMCTGLVIGLVLVPLAGLYITQSDLGTTIICLVGILTVVWLSDVSIPLFIGVLVIIVAFGVLAVFGVGYRADRLSFLNPESDYYGSGYQLIRSFYAFGEGGLFGVGLGNSTEKYLYLPEAETDFIFAIIGEELGLVGALAVIVLFLVLLVSGLLIARQAPDLFGTMIAGGCTVMLVFQAFLNIGCVVGIMPTTGKPLPFISAGGSALLGSFLLVGFILSVSFASGATSGVFERRRNDLVVVSSRQGKASGARQGRGSSSGRGGRTGAAGRARTQSGPSNARAAARQRSELRSAARASGTGRLRHARGRGR